MPDSRSDDRLAIQDVMLRYATSVDDRDFDSYISCFTEDVHIVGFGPEPLDGHGAVRAFVVEALAPFGVTQHLMSAPLVTFAGDKAHARTYVQASHWLKDVPGRAFVLWGTYETDFVRAGKEWKIAKHHLITRASKEQ